MGRYLLFFSYIGTNYRGMQIQREAGEVLQRIKTVQGVLEDSLRFINPTNDVMVKTSSRTDSNVHALSNAAHIDLVHRRHPFEYNPHWITANLNKYFNHNNEKIRILNTIRVPDAFHSRTAAIKRTYIYRLAVLKKTEFYSDLSSIGLPWGSMDDEFCTKVYPPFDMSKFLESAQMLTGYHSFLSFTTKAILKSNYTITHQGFIPLTICIKRSSALMGGNRPEVDSAMEIWEIHFSAKSFLFKQIRRMMGAMVAVAKGQMTLEQLQQLRDNPSLDNPGRIQALPGYGLFLKEVLYPDHVYRYNQCKLWQTELTQQRSGCTYLNEYLPERSDLSVFKKEQATPADATAGRQLGEDQQKQQNSDVDHDGLKTAQLFSSKENGQTTNSEVTKR